MARIIYVGNLPGDVRESEVENLFQSYGRITRVSIKAGVAGGMPAFSFVEFTDADDAYDAVKGMDGRDAFGKRLRVELSRGKREDRRDDRRDDFGRGGGGGNYRGEARGRSGGGNPRPYNTAHRVLVTGLPPTASWQDLKDHMRKGGEVTFAQVVREGDGLLGLVDYATADDMHYAIKKLDDSEFRNPYDRSFIRIKEDKDRTRGAGGGGGGGGDRDRDRDRGRERDRSRSRSRSRSRDRSRGDSPPQRRRSRSPVDDDDDDRR